METSAIKKTHLERTIDAIDEYNLYLSNNIRNLEICINQAIFFIESKTDSEEKAYWVSEKLRFENELNAFTMSRKSLIHTMKDHKVIQLY
jgi:hypothetical protein